LEMATGAQVIFEVVQGSRAFGLDRAGSDEDLRDVLCVAIIESVW
jgi:predicted nucleotidyltransferase